jgi:hypothetical protein
MKLDAATITNVITAKARSSAIGGHSGSTLRPAMTIRSGADHEDCELHKVQHRTKL